MLLQPKRMLIIGAFLVIFGVVVPFLMVLRLIETTFWLSFLAYAASVAGLLFGVIGAAMYVRQRKF